MKSLENVVAGRILGANDNFDAVVNLMEGAFDRNTGVMHTLALD
jgi:hypothetical protein